MSEQEPSENNIPEQQAVTVTISGIPVEVVHAAEQLRDHMQALHDDKNYLAFLMAVNIQTARADLIPIPTLDNIVKLKRHLETLPEGIKDAIKNNIPKEDMKAIDDIWLQLNKSGGANEEDRPGLPPTPISEEM